MASQECAGRTTVISTEAEIGKTSSKSDDVALMAMGKG